MRVLAINSMFANRLYRRCADELGALPGVELTILTVDKWIMNGREMPMESVSPDAPYRTVIGRSGWRGKENRGFYTSGIMEAFRVAKPEIIFLMEEPFSVFSLQILQANKLTGTNAPVVFFTWNNLSLDIYDYRPSIFYRNVAKYTLPRMQAALTANTAGIDVLRSFGFNAPIALAGYGVDTDKYRSVEEEVLGSLRVRLRIEQDDFVVGYIGRMLHMKGLDLLIDAFAQQQKLSARRLKLLLVGSGPEQNAILKLAQDRGISDSLIHVPSVPHGDVPAYLHLMDTLVLPSRRVGMWAEQFGRVLVEAMAAGKVVIGSSSGAIPEVIGNAGFVFQENDPHSLSAELSKVIGLDDASRSSLVTLGRDRAANSYSWRRFAETAHGSLLKTLEGSHK
ncbi:MAG TPA: glycosyltransferase [Candidatus Kapabacteria bacterium]|nr:glycosyltransferase [Candidatus Kapabacteria bacterium]